MTHPSNDNVQLDKVVQCFLRTFFAFIFLLKLKIRIPKASAYYLKRTTKNVVKIYLIHAK